MPPRHRRSADRVPAPPKVPDAETIVLPRVVDQGRDPGLTVLLPRSAPIVAQPSPGLADLAKRHGLRPAGKRPGFIAYLGQVWRFRAFIGSYANGRLVAQFSSARLGQVWQVLTPLLNAAIYYLIFAVVLNTDRDIENFVGYLCIGVFIFSFTHSAVTSGVDSIGRQLGLVRAMMFPRAALPVAMTLTHIQGLLVSMGVLMGIVVFTGDPVSVNWVLLLPALALQAVFSLGLAMLVARIGVQVPDVRQLMPYLMRTWMYFSGVLYSVRLFDNLPPALETVATVNPMLVYIELVRYALLESPVLASAPNELWLLGGGWALFALVVGYVYFWFGEPEYGRG
jgi:teichoic acid transport system permease protein